MHIYKAEGIRNYESIVANPPQGIGAVRTALTRALRSTDTVGWSANEESGRLNRRSFVRYATGSSAIFSRRIQSEAEKTAVYIMVDCSGSMTGQEILTTTEVCVHLSEILSKTRSEFSIVGFDCGNRIELRLHVFKGWNESLVQCRARIGSMPLTPDGGTPDYSAMYHGVECLQARDEAKKILFFITDAQGTDAATMKHCEKMAETFGVNLIVIGIGRQTGVESIYKNAVQINSIDELPGAAFRKLLESIK
jgi:cobalamin biosynthesis protein CobT